MEDDERASVRRQTPEASVEVVAVGQSRSAVRGGRSIERIQRNVEPMPPEPLGLVETAVHEQSVEPGVEAVGIAQRPHVAPRTYERLLDRVFGLLGIVQDEPGGA